MMVSSVKKYISMSVLLVILFSVFFPLLHLLNGWVFRFAEVTPHISLIYLPAFLRLANVLILGPVQGSLATLLGGLILMWFFIYDTSVAEVLNTVCSTAGPLAALLLFRMYARREVDLTSLKDLTVLTLMYAIANAVLHHVMWSVLDPSSLKSPSQLAEMIVGDISGALLGAYAMKWGIVKYRQFRLASELRE